MPKSECKIVLERPPDCQDFRKVRAYVMCKAHDVMAKERIPFRDAIRRGWQDVKKVCVT